MSIFEQKFPLCSVASHLSYCFVRNLLLSLSAKEFFKRVSIRTKNIHVVATFFQTRCTALQFQQGWWSEKNSEGLRVKPASG